MDVIDRIDHAELGEVSLGRADDELVRKPAVTALIEEGDVVVVFEEYTSKASTPFMLPSKLSVFHSWEIREEKRSGRYTCFLCGDIAEKTGVYNETNKPVMAHVSCIEQAIECIELLIERNSAVVSAEVI